MVTFPTGAVKVRALEMVSASLYVPATIERLSQLVAPLTPSTIVFFGLNIVPFSMSLGWSKSI